MSAPPADPRVLVVDDDHDVADSLSLLLQVLGYDVCVAYSGFEAIDVAGGYRPNAVVMDINMPGLDGLHTARRLKNDRRLDRTTFIAHTASDDTFMRRIAAQIGFNHFVRKGELTSLTRILQPLLAKARNRSPSTH